MGQPLELLVGFNSFGHDLKAKGAGHGEDGLGESSGGRVVTGGGSVHRLYKGAVDFERVDREGMEVTQGRIASAKVVDRKRDTEGAKVSGMALEVFERHEGAFGEFEFKESGAEAGIGEGAPSVPT